MTQQSPKQTWRARSLRRSQTPAEGMLWSALRGSQLCGVKFRRQHPIGPFFADFAAQSHRLVVELDGDYHDHIQQRDLRRDQHLSAEGWNVVRFLNDEVLNDVESVLRSIARHLNLPYEHKSREKDLGGMFSDDAPATGVSWRAPNREASDG